MNQTGHDALICGLDEFLCPGCAHERREYSRREAAALAEGPLPTTYCRSHVLDVRQFMTLPPSERPAAAGRLLEAEDCRGYRRRRAEAARLAELMEEHPDLFAAALLDLVRDALADDLPAALDTLRGRS